MTIRRAWHFSHPSALRRTWLRLACPVLPLLLAPFTAPGAGGSGPRAPLPPPEERAKLPPDGGAEFNRLVHETSPYLNQHARNPVDWYPWGPEAFEKARREDKPVFLSVGYSSCHWCHVMEHESFEHPNVAALLNQYFVSIKVDREERPDVDEIYMTATQLVTGRGGWPNSVWLTPDKQPFFAGTYYRQPDFVQLLEALNQAWQEQRADIEGQAQRLAEAVRASSEPGPTAPAKVPLDTWLGTVENHLQSTLDPVYGGFGRAPKFPPHGALRFLLACQELKPDETLLQPALVTLDAMARGGLHDHAGGGFHRYSTDTRWLVPHFEKMLYDNAQLLRVYATAYHLTQRPAYRYAAEGIVHWLQREMTGAHGEFYAALDADSDGEEGKYYVWTRKELDAILGDQADAFAAMYQVTEDGNYHDEATGRNTGTNILHLDKFPPDKQRENLQSALDQLERQRRKRVPPALDDKILTSWNGLTVGALAQAGEYLNHPEWIEHAGRTADYLLKVHRTGEGNLYRTSRLGQARLKAYLDDYAFLADGLLDLYEASGDARRLQQARELARYMRTHFEDAEHGGFFFTAHDHESLLARTKEPFDRAEPSGNGVAARVFYRLYQAAGQEEDLQTAQQTLQTFLPLLVRAPQASATFAELALRMEQTGEQPEAATAPATFRLLGPDQVEPGASFELVLELTVKDGWHINTQAPGLDYLLPLRISMKSIEYLTASPPGFPPGTNLQLDGTEETIHVYRGTVRIPTRIQTSPDLPEGTLRVSITVDWQACDDSSCLAPESTVLTHGLTVRPASAQ